MKNQCKTYPVAWMFWRGGKPSQRWSKDHLTLDDKHTLCGLRIPDAFANTCKGIAVDLTVKGVGANLSSPPSPEIIGESAKQPTGYSVGQTYDSQGCECKAMVVLECNLVNHWTISRETKA